MSDDIVTLEVSDHIAIVTLNRPPVNALNRAMRDRIVSVFDEISERSDVRVAILTGNGKIFCSGADLKDRPDPTKVGAFHDQNPDVAVYIAANGKLAYQQVMDLMAALQNVGIPHVALMSQPTHADAGGPGKR